MRWTVSAGRKGPGAVREMGPRDYEAFVYRLRAGPADPVAYWTAFRELQGAEWLRGWR